MVQAITDILRIFGQSVTLVKPTEVEYGSGSTKKTYGVTGTTVIIALQKRDREIVQDVEGQENFIDAYATFDTDLDVNERDMFILTSGEKFIVLKEISRNDNMNNNILRHVKVALQIWDE